MMGGGGGSSQSNNNSGARRGGTSQGQRSSKTGPSVETFNRVKNAVEQLGVACSDELIMEACTKFPHPDAAVDALLNHQFQKD